MLSVHIYPHLTQIPEKSQNMAYNFYNSESILVLEIDSPTLSKKELKCSYLKKKKKHCYYYFKQCKFV